MAINEKFNYENFETTPLIRKLSFFAAGGPFLDGYILVMIGIAMSQLGPILHVDKFWHSMIVTASQGGMFFGAIIFGYVTDKIGRKLMFTIDLIAMAILSILCMFISSPMELVILRFGIGAAVGADYPIATALVTELTPRLKRGWAVGLMSATWYVGATAADIVGYFLYNIPGGWVYMLGSSAIPAIILVLGRLGTPESPVWLVNKGRIEEAREVIHKVFGPTAEIETGFEAQKPTNFFTVFQSGYLKRVFLVAVIYTTQIIPMWAIYSFGPTIMGAFGLGEGNAANLGDIIISAFFLIGTVAAMYWIQSWGRRPLGIWSYVLMTLSMLVLGFFPSGAAPLVIGAFACYAFFSGGPGMMEWLYPNELFPTEVRASAVGVAVAISRFGAYGCTFGIPYALSAWGLGTTMLFGAAISAFGLIVVYFMAPETKDMTLAQSSSLGKLSA